MLPASSTKELAIFFEQLDKESKPLREMAQDFAGYLAIYGFNFPETESLIKALKKVAITSIDKMDIAINGLKDRLVVVSKKLEDPKIKKILEQHLPELDTFVVRSMGLVGVISSLLDKIITLDKQSN